MQPDFRTLIADAWRVLTFRRPSPAIAQHWQAYLTLGLFFTWVAGIGRYWDNPKANLLQNLGLGSVVYVFCLALVIWLIAWPLRPKQWSYRSVLVFVTLTAPPAILYAIPVEKFMTLSLAQNVNVWFLAVVAAWRVALYFWFLRTFAGLSGGAIVVATLLPLVAIVMSLTVLNLEHVVFEMMAGIRAADRTSADKAYEVIIWLTLFSQLTFPILLFAYALFAYMAWHPNKDADR